MPEPALGGGFGSLQQGRVLGSQGADVAPSLESLASHSASVAEGAEGAQQTDLELELAADGAPPDVEHPAQSAAAGAAHPASAKVPQRAFGEAAHFSMSAHIQARQ